MRDIDLYIYVCTEKDRDKLLESGFEMVGTKKGTSLWMFDAEHKEKFNLDDMLDVYIVSNVVMF